MKPVSVSLSMLRWAWRVQEGDGFGVSPWGEPEVVVMAWEPMSSSLWSISTVPGLENVTSLAVVAVQQ